MSAENRGLLHLFLHLIGLLLNSENTELMNQSIGIRLVLQFSVLVLSLNFENVVTLNT